MVVPALGSREGARVWGEAQEESGSVQSRDSARPRATHAELFSV